MDKLEIKKQIERLKADLVQHKDRYKRMNESFKKHIVDLQKQASNQSNKESSARIKSQIASKKQNYSLNEFVNEYSDTKTQIKNLLSL